MGKIDDKDKELLDILMEGLKETAGEQPADMGMDFGSGNISSKLREAFDTISSLEKKNSMLVHHLQTLKSTYEFFEQSNDMRVLYGNHQYAQ